jgi:hypothetical protein
VVALGILQRHDQHGQLLGCALVITEPSLAVAEDSMRLSEVLDRSVDEARPELVDGAGKGDGPIGGQEERVPLVLVQEACLAEFPNPWRACSGPKDLEELVDAALQVIRHEAQDFVGDGVRARGFARAEVRQQGVELVRITNGRVHPRPGQLVSGQGGEGHAVTGPGEWVLVGRVVGKVEPCLAAAGWGRESRPGLPRRISNLLSAGHDFSAQSYKPGDAMDCGFFP